MLRASGYPLQDIGEGLNVEEMVDKTINENIDILLVSTLMIPSALNVKQLVKMIREKSSKAKAIVVGALFRLDSDLWQKFYTESDGKIK